MDENSKTEEEAAVSPSKQQYNHVTSRYMNNTSPRSKQQVPTGPVQIPYHSPVTSPLYQQVKPRVFDFQSNPSNAAVTSPRQLVQSRKEAEMSKWVTQQK